MWSKMRNFVFVDNKASYIGWFVTTHLTLAFFILFVMLLFGINPTLVVSVIAAPLWICVALLSKYITDKIMERKQGE
jgi:L-asparagine transporter-like permease|tara:strand:+ start:166 stop:396 length:231 start_codon:yes stop_codon:yes gene_type:complete